MYSINKILDYKFELFFNGKYKGTLVMFEKEANLIVRCLNTHPLIDEE